MLPTLIIGLTAGAPLLAALLTLAAGRMLPRSRIHWPACAGAAMSLAAVVVAVGLLTGSASLPERPLLLYDWLALEDAAPVSVNLQIDALSALFLVVSGIATLVVLHQAAATAAGDAYGVRFYTFASFLQFATVMLLLAVDWLALFFFWQLTALAALFLTRQDSAQQELRPPGGLRPSGRLRPPTVIGNRPVQRFLVMRAADVALLAGVLMLWSDYGTFDFVPAGGEGGESPVIGLCILAAVAARCLRFPLPGSGPAVLSSPAASAPVEAALFMPLGIYLAARSAPLISASPPAQTAAMCVGGAAAAIGALSAVAQTESHRRLGASTSSLYGMALLGLAIGTLAGVMAALVLTAVYVLAMTGLWHAAPSARWAFLAGAIVLCSGFWGQHAVLEAAAESVRRESDPAHRRLILAAYWSAMASLPCLSFALTRGFLSLGRAGGDDRFNSRGAGSWAVWTLPIAAAAIPVLVFGLPGVFDAVAGGGRPLGEEIGITSLLTVDVGLPLVLLGAVAAWLSWSIAASTKEDRPLVRSRLARASAVRWAQDGFGLATLWRLLVGLPLRLLVGLCRFVDIYLFDAAWRRLPAWAVALPARAAGALQTGEVQFYALAVLLATALVLLVLTEFKG